MGIEQAVELWQNVIITAIAKKGGKEEDLQLLPGVDEQAWDPLAENMKLEIPAEIKAFYQVHGGQQDEMGATPFVRNLTLLSVNAILEQWQFLNEEVELDEMEVDNGPGVRPVVWSPAWIPVATNGAGDYLCLDTDPDQGGTYGQVLYYWHDWEDRCVEAESWFAFIELCLAEED
ncbi:SMI1/KNR4 family protein [Paenibacillus wulumuqiensis]|uniref:SMI1/KNR4 family protein n=1 Tax=Paenibacillus wulumuqiensis TaxID=1567107 RepID=UPI000AFD3302|nr:SMI1/KNR4 family protein [Paenibacillus wulumuqiensis]